MNSEPRQNDRCSQRHPSRHDFLKTTAAAATLGGLTLSRSAHAAGSDVIRIGVVGCGNLAQVRSSTP